MHRAENVHVAGLKPAVDLGALFGQESRGLSVLGWASKVDGGVCGVPVSADDDLEAFFAEGLGAGKDSVREFHFEGDTGVVILTIGEVGPDHLKVAVTRLNQPAFIVELLDPEAHVDFIRSIFGEGGDPAVSLLDGA